MAVNIRKMLRSITPGNRPSGGVYGQQYVNFGDNQFGVFDSSNVARDLIGVPFFSAAAAYSAGQPVNFQGNLYVALVAITAAAWNPAQWFRVSNSIRSVKVQKFTASGTYTPSAGLVHCIAEGVGGGGGGGGVSAGATAGTSLGGGGGGGGGYSRLLASAATIGASQAVTIGAVGLGGAAGGNSGTAGGITSVGALLIARGGSGGIFASPTSVGAGGAGGTPGTGDIISAGQPGTYGGYNVTRSTVSIVSCPGNGGSSFFGGGGITTGATSSIALNGASGSNYGGGGAGAFIDSVAGGNAAGGNGSPGFVMITEFCNV